MLYIKEYVIDEWSLFHSTDTINVERKDMILSFLVNHYVTTISNEICV